MTLPRLAAFNKYWQQNPPLHQIVAAYIGYKPPEEQPKEMDLAGLIAAMGG